MSSKGGTSSVKTYASLRGSLNDSELRTNRSRGDSGTEFSLNVESSHHSYPKTPGTIPIAYGQTATVTDTRLFPRNPYGDNAAQRSQPETHAYPGGSAALSPFVSHAQAAPGFPFPNYQTTAIHPLPYHSSNPYPQGYQPQGCVQTPYTLSGSLFVPPDYTQRAHTTGSIFTAAPPGAPYQGVNLTPPSTSYTMPFNQQQQEFGKENTETPDDCFNIFWLFFLLGPLTWPCGVFGICSTKQSERMAGIVSAVCLVLVIVAVIIVVTQTPSDNDG